MESSTLPGVWRSPFSIAGPGALMSVRAPRMHWKAASRRKQVSRTVARVFAGWRTGLPGLVIALQAGTAVNYFGTGLILPFGSRSQRGRYGARSSTTPSRRCDDVMSGLHLSEERRRWSVRTR
jgi:hypothetical protein